jgi:hypothetical protein
MRDSYPNLQTIPFDPLCGYIRSRLISNKSVLPFWNANQAEKFCYIASSGIWAVR